MKKAPKVKTYETIVIPVSEQSISPTCPYDGASLYSHDFGGVWCKNFCKRRFNIHYEGDEE